MLQITPRILKKQSSKQENNQGMKAQSNKPVGVLFWVELQVLQNIS
jgi:hypothetical protein